jgi:Domain of unknown function (DUF1772)
MQSIGLVFLGLGTAGLAFVIGANLYELVVVVPAWRSMDGLRTWREVIARRHPGYFFLTVAPSALLCLVVGTGLGWSHSGRRTAFSLAAVAALLAGLVFTKVFFVPRNRKLFLEPPSDESEGEVRQLVHQWIAANRLRVLIAGIGLMCALIAIHQ